MFRNNTRHRCNIRKPNNKQNNIQVSNPTSSTIYTSTNIKIIMKNDIDNFIKDLININEVVIFGKGPSFKIIEKTDNLFFICINQTINFIDNCDMLVINDLHNIYLIDEKKIENLKYILTPEYLHVDHRFKYSGNCKKVIEYLETKKFRGKYIIFNLNTNPIANINLITLPSTISSSNTATDFVCMFMNKIIKKISYYGVGIYNEQKYNNIFTGNGKYGKAHSDTIKNHIINTCSNYSIKYILN
jgi:hypothetical protein